MELSRNASASTRTDDAGAAASDDSEAANSSGGDDARTFITLATRTERVVVLAPLFAGGLFAAGWFVFIDGYIMQHKYDLRPVVTAAHFIPGFVATLGMLMTIVTPVRVLMPHSFVALTASGGASCLRFWLFCAFIVSFSAVASSMKSLTMNFTPPQTYTDSTYREEPQQQHFFFRNSDALSSNNNESDELALPAEEYYTWPGVAMVLQSSMIFASAMCVIYGRMRAAARRHNFPLLGPQ